MNDEARQVPMLSVAQARQALEEAYDRELPHLYAFLKRELERRDRSAALYVDQVVRHQNMVRLPIGTDEAYELFDWIDFLQELEDRWNDQAPAPALSLTLMPTGSAHIIK